MDVNFDSMLLTLTCPHCGSEFRERLGRFKDQNPIPCPTCEKPIQIDASELIRTTTDEINGALADLSAELKGLGKGRKS